MADKHGTVTTEQEKGSATRPPLWKRLWEWTEFGKKTGWQWLELLSTLAIPVVLAIAGYWFTMQQDARQQQIEEQRAQDAALQAYLDQTSQLLIEKGLRDAQPEHDVSVVTRARTLTTLGRVDGARKRSILLFLYESGLLHKGDELVVDLSGADLSDAKLNGAHLPNMDLARGCYELLRWGQ
jgi:hypothetical protein